MNKEYKGMVRKEIESCFIPRLYLVRGYTKRDIFKMKTLRLLGKTYRKESL